MSERPFLSHFSPQWTQPEYLEAILVQRGELLAESVAAVRDSILTGHPRHLLFVGPRGAGKTHLVTLIQHRLSHDADLTDRMRVAWLNEDETATSFLRLLIAIYRSLAERYPAEFSADTIPSLAGKEPGVALEQLGQALRRDLGGRVIVCIMENLDSLFRSLTLAEQRNWRAFLQNHPVILTVGTAQTLFDGIADHDEPFYGFFDTRHLQPLSVDEARDLLVRIARLNGRTDVADFLQTSTGRARVDAIRALAGGNPRLYLIFSDLLVDKGALNDLVRPFEEMVDRQLTSYYQERLRWLSPQQREIIQFLCHSRSPVPVKHIADGLFTTHNSITGQLKQLRDMRYVDSHPLGREVLYELAEPLMRLALQVKETHDRRPLALIVDFLRVWHERREIEDRLASCAADSPARAYLEEAHRLMLTEPSLRHELFRRDLDFADPEQCDDTTLAKAQCLAENSSTAEDWFKLGSIHYLREEWKEAVGVLTRVIEMASATPDEIVLALHRRGVAYHYIGKPDHAVADWTRVIELPDAIPDHVAKALNNRALCSAKAGRFAETICDSSLVIELSGASVEAIAKALVNRGIAFGILGKCEDAVNDYSRVITLQEAPPEEIAVALLNRGVCNELAGNFAEAISDCTKAINLNCGLSEVMAKAHHNRAAFSAHLKQHNQALSDLLIWLTLPDADFEQFRASMNLGYWVNYVVTAAFASTTDAARWKATLTEFAGHFARFDGLAQFGEAAVQHLPTLAASPLNHAAWDAWADAWEAARAALPEKDRDRLDIPLRLLRAGIGWLKTKDEAHLLTLPGEERRILRQALGLPEKKR